jgi:hypothetical protein
MNERLEALDDEAQEYAGRIAGNDEDSNYNAWFNIYKEKFAELIVKECVDLFPLTSRPLSGGAIQSMIKQHFGVKNERKN